MECGINGLIIPDLPFEEKDEISELCRTYEVDLISMIAPTSEERIRKIAADATGFLYVVSSLGVTGVRSEIQNRYRIHDQSCAQCIRHSGGSRIRNFKSGAGTGDGREIRRRDRRICNCQNCRQIWNRMRTAGEQFIRELRKGVDGAAQ